MTSPVVTLTTDFGTQDSYVAELKAVLLSRLGAVSLIDVSHEVRAGDIQAAAWVLGRVWDHFPLHTVHLAVVDPGVGTARVPIAIRMKHRWFVGPDNGLITFVERPRADIETPLEQVIRLDPSRCEAAGASHTFHGRDLFAPAAAHLAAGGSPEELGDPTPPARVVRLAIPPPERREDSITGPVVHVDRFGTLVTGIPGAWMIPGCQVEVEGAVIGGVRRTFGEVDRGEVVALIGSAGTLEIAVREGSARQVLGVGRGATVRVR